MPAKKKPSTKTRVEEPRAAGDRKKKSTATKNAAARSTTSKRKSANGHETHSMNAPATDNPPSTDERPITELGDDLISGKKTAAVNAARAIDALVEQSPETVTPIIDRFVKAIGASEKRPAQTAATALPIMARVAPARVARHLPRLKDSFDDATPVGKDGLVRTFAGLCTASVAYQKRLEGVLNKALGEADAKTLQKWTEVVLPALKGEPHARARATVEARLERIPKAVAQKIADFLGIKLRLRYR